MRYSIVLLVMCCSIAATVFWPVSSHAQRLDNRTIMGRIDRMERDIMYLQRQVSQQGDAMGSSYAPEGDTVSNARTQAGLASLAEDIRKLRGELEEQDHRYRTLQERMERLAQDMEYRLSALENGGTATARQAQESFSPAPPTSLPAPAYDNDPFAPQPTGTLPAAPSAATPAAPAADSFGTSREHYNQAFRLLNQAQYEEAGQLFKSFIERYPGNPLIGNAWYWMGESYYVRRNYVQAADSFRQGFEAATDGPKAGDNLLKLGMSLAALDREQEACVVLRQLDKKYGDNSASLRQKAKQELTRIGCK